jgi:hypothetical protein
MVSEQHGHDSSRLQRCITEFDRESAKPKYLTCEKR